ncbi:hypothetical protein [Mesorhizobium sp. M1E.F.Ca.ET.063.01.1.1]|uniref:hypothetical protein n=1 Tax=Mesorhizobium sp. M1E.F.Ca.ET.063.01.1.1 TaxID=2496750 RepID=UPI001FE00162|nr:hypothetical protein [Mesorhizobium sp. M1E.F.Ca.ET.063.01.1.1]
MAVTPDNRTLIVAESHANRLTAMPLAKAMSSATCRTVSSDVISTMVPGPKCSPGAGAGPPPLT